MKRALPSGVWAIGTVSLLMDSSSELIHALLPAFLVGTLGASAAALGVIEGLAEATALVVKVGSGVLSDWVGRRKFLTVFGYGLSAATKPLFALATTLGVVLFARLTDRVGKGIRGAPRDALMSDITPAAQRGRAFGLRQGLDSLGAVLGPLAAAALMVMWDDDIRRVLWVAVIPAVAAVALLVLAVKEPPKRADHKPEFPIRRQYLRLLPGSYWAVTAIGAVFSLARFSEAFVLLRGFDVGMAVAAVPLVLVVMNAVYAAMAYPVGAQVDRGRELPILMLGVLTLAASQLVLAKSSDGAAVLAGAALWGAHLGMTQGLLAALVSLSAPSRMRGTAFGLFNVVSGLMLLAGSVVAGLLWDAHGPSATFWVGAMFALLTALALAGLGGRISR